MERIIQFFEVTARVVDVFSLLLLVVGFLRGAVGWMAQEWRRLPWSERFRPFRRLRCVVGLHILFALELLIISDIIHTFLAVVEHHAMEGAFYHSATFNALVHLAVVVAIRTLIDFVLAKEVEAVHEPASGDAQ